VQKKGQEDMSDQRCCGISAEHPYRDRRQCRTLKKLQVEVLTHLLLKGRDEGPHAFEPVLEYVLKLEKGIRNRDEEIAVVRALLAERPALQGRRHDEAQQPGLAAEPRNHDCGGQVAAGEELGERPGRFREQDPAA
jgi:hypothetical protein